jgi:hypothetical protein
MSQRFPVVGVALVVLSVHVLAQDVFVTRGENGPVFSDKPQSGAKEVKLRPLTVVPAPDTVSTSDARKPVDWPAGTPERVSREAAPAYRSLRMVMPTDGGSVAGDTALLEVRLDVTPPLLAGHSFMVRIDGRPVDQRFTATEFVIPPEFWPDGFLPSGRSVQIDVAVVDERGQVVLRAPSARFRTLAVVGQAPYSGTYPGTYPGAYPGVYPVPLPAYVPRGPVVHPQPHPAKPPVAPRRPAGQNVLPGKGRAATKE